MKASLNLRLSQHLALTPQLQQSIRLLQLSTLELNQEMTQMLAENPFLELGEADGEQDEVPQDSLTETVETPSVTDPLVSDTMGGEHALQSATSTSSSADGPDAELTPELDSPADFTSTLDQDDYGDRQESPDLPSRANGTSDDEQDDDYHTRRPDLHEHLHSQAAGLRLSDVERALLHWVIESVDEQGYTDIRAEDPESWGPDLCARLIEQSELDEETTESNNEEDCASLLNQIWMPRVQCALRLLQSMDPPGVGARDLPECLILQLRQLPRSQPQSLAILICKDHLDTLAKRDIKRLIQATGADEALVRQAHALIAQLDPRPGRAFDQITTAAVVPDVIVRAQGRGWQVQLNPDVLPKLRINDLYASVIRQQRGKGEQALQSSLQEARWFIKNIQQRFDTILRVSRAIVERQRQFLTHGAVGMRPLVLREIADELGLHESTISRVTTAKYMATPQGVFELKYFFGSGLATEAGGNASSTAVRALIQKMIAEEHPSKPLSDAKLSDMLEAQGIQVARRTVAKYREGLRIAPANLRKAV